MIRIGFDAKRFFHNQTGLGNYSRTILYNFYKYYHRSINLFLFTPFASDTDSLPTEGLVNRSNIIFPPSRKTFLWRTFFIVRELKKYQINLYHGLSNELPFEFFKSKNIKWVVTIHDIAFLYFKKDYFIVDRIIQYYKIKYSCQKADLIIAISEFTKKDICRRFNIIADKVQVLYQTVQDIFKVKYQREEILQTLGLYHLPTHFYLYVGSITERKNLITAISAWQSLPETYQIPFVIIGGSNRNYRKKLIKEIKLLSEENQNKILFRTVENNHLPLIYQRASIFIYPSFFEGFGIPVLEALYSGTPVITSKTSSLPEVAGPGAYLIDPSSSKELRDGIIYFMSNHESREKSIEAGYEHIKKFHAEELSSRLLKIYQGLLG
jgi:glycosyltransferase involved in cell wall biosynthesis